MAVFSKLDWGTMDYYQTVIEILDQLSAESDTAVGKIKKLPNGEIRKYQNGNYNKYFLKLPGKSLSYLSTSQVKLIEQLARKTYLQRYLEFHEIGQKELQKFLITHQDWLNVRAQLLEDFPFLSDNLAYTDLERELKIWEDAPYKQCPYHPENKKVEGAKGIMMRSKGEGDISYDLLNDREPFHYEQLWNFPEGNFYPDFTIRHPKTGEFILWEHFGMMDKPEYVAEVARKLQIYEANGFCPENNLIVTYEDKEHPLSHRRILNEIDYFFH